MKTLASIFIASLIMIVAFAAPTKAQDAPLELAGSYQFLRPVCPGVSCYNYPGGWQGSVATRVTRWLSVVGEAGESLKTFSTSTSGPIALTSTTSGTLINRSNTRLAIYDVLGGPRATMQIARMSMFGELLFGISRNTFATSNSTSIPEEGASVGSSSSLAATAWAWQPRVGIDIPVSPRWATRFGVGYRVGGAVPRSLSHGDVLLETGIVFRVRP
jgi:hypothetical protein